MTVSAEPDLVRVSVLGGATQLDSGLPAHLPVAALIPDLLTALRISTDDDVAAWTLARVDGSRLSPSETLAQGGVLDGDLLLMRPDRPDARSPLIDDVADGVASALRRDRAGWTAEASRGLGYLVFLAGVLAAIPAGRLAAAADRPTVLTVAVVGAALLLAVVLAGRRLGVDPRTATVATIGACGLAALAVSLIAPEVGGGAQVAVAAMTAGVIATVGWRVTGHAAAVHVTVACAAALCVVGGAVSAFTSLTVAEVAAIVVVLAIGVVLSAPRLAVALGRLPLPEVPTTAPDPTTEADPGTVDGVDALRLRDRDRLGAIADLALGDLQSLARRAASTASILTGLLAGAVLAAAAATTVLAASAGETTVVQAFCVCAVAALSARGRTHTDRVQSTILVAGGGITAVAATLALLATESGPRPVTVFAIVLAVAVAAVLLGTVAAGGDYSPPAVRTAEIVEYAVLVALVPLLLWVLGVYQAVRQL